MRFWPWKKANFKFGGCKGMWQQICTWPVRLRQRGWRGFLHLWRPHGGWSSECTEVSCNPSGLHFWQVLTLLRIQPKNRHLTFISTVKMFILESFNTVQLRRLFCGVICVASLDEKSDNQLDCKDFCWPFMFFGWPITSNIVPDELLPETVSMPNETAKEMADMADADVALNIEAPAPKLQVRVGEAEDFSTDGQWCANSLCGNLYQKNWFKHVSSRSLDLGMSNVKNNGEPQDVFVLVVKCLKFYGRFRNTGASSFRTRALPQPSQCQSMKSMSLKWTDPGSTTRQGKMRTGEIVEIFWINLKFETHSERRFIPITSIDLYRPIVITLTGCLP